MAREADDHIRLVSRDGRIRLDVEILENTGDPSDDHWWNRFTQLIFKYEELRRLPHPTNRRRRKISDGEWQRKNQQRRAEHDSTSPEGLWQGPASIRER